LGNKKFSLNEERDIHLSDMYSYLGKAYEGEYEFEKALICYQKTQSLTPFWAAPYCHICSILIKQNKLNEAMKIYLDAKNSPYYTPFKFKSPFGETYTEDSFKIVIDKHIIELRDKIERGYIYKPRGKKK
jgi:tetratricopeptide (TPR) repeat protein